MCLSVLAYFYHHYYMDSARYATAQEVVAAYKLHWTISSWDKSELILNVPVTELELFLMAEKLCTLRQLDEQRFKQICADKGLVFDMASINNLGCAIRKKLIVAPSP